MRGLQIASVQRPQKRLAAEPGPYRSESRKERWHISSPHILFCSNESGAVRQDTHAGSRIAAVNGGKCHASGSAVFVEPPLGSITHQIRMLPVSRHPDEAWRSSVAPT